MKLRKMKDRIGDLWVKYYPITIQQGVFDEETDETLDVTLTNIKNDITNKPNHGYVLGEGEEPKTLKEVDEEKALHGYSEEEEPKTLKEVDDNLVQLAGDKANHGYDAGETPKSLKQVDDLLIKYQNIISNGNFADGTTSGWSVSNSSGTIQVINGILEHTANGTTTSGQASKTISPVTGKRYLAVKARVTNSLCTNLSVRTIRRNGATPFQSIATPLQDTWYIVSNLIDPSSFIGGYDSSFFFQVINYYPSIEIASGKKMEIEFVIDIDLTAIFGAGNEPSKQFMDDLLSKVGYFEEYTPKSDILLSISTDAKHGYPSLAEAKTVKQIDDAKLEKSSLVTTSGDSHDNIMSQKSVTDSIVSTTEILGLSDLQPGLIYLNQSYISDLIPSPDYVSTSIEVRPGNKITIIGKSTSGSALTYAFADSSGLIIERAPQYSVGNSEPINLVAPENSAKIYINQRNTNTFFKLFFEKTSLYLHKRLSNLENRDFIHTPIQNKLLDIHKYGISSDMTGGVSNIWYNGEYFFTPSGAVFRQDLIPKILTGCSGRYFGLIVGIDTGISYFNIRNSSSINIAGYTSYAYGDKKLIFVDFNTPEAESAALYLTKNIKIYNMFLTDDLPSFNLIPYEINTPVELIDIFHEERNNFTIDYLPTITSTAPFSSSRFNTYKKYIIAEVESSLPELRHNMFQIRGYSYNGTELFAKFIRPGKYTVIDIPDEVITDISYLRYVKTGTGVTGSFIRFKNMRTSDSLSLTIKKQLDIPNYETAYEGKDRKIDVFNVGKTTFFGQAPETIRKNNDFTEGGYSDYSMYEYTGKKLSFKEAKNIKYIDLGSNRLKMITPEGDVLLSNSNNILKTTVDELLSSIQIHDNTGLEYTRLKYINLPQDATLQEKSDYFNSIKTNWYQYTGNPTNISNIAGNRVARRFSNGNIFFSNFLLRADGTAVTPILKNPVAINPTHLLIKSTTDVIIHEIPLYGNISESYRWGSFVPDQGAINYTESIKAVINFTNEKTLTVQIPQELPAGTYKFVIRGRRNSTTLVDGTIDVQANNSSIGSITLSGTGTCRQLLDNETISTLPTPTSEIKLFLSCATTKNLTVGNNLSSAGNWGNTAEGKFGTIVEYVAAPQRGEGKCYFTQDSGETWEELFDVGLNELFDGSSRCHLHGARYDRYWNKLYIVGGDYDENRAFHHADITNQTSIDNISWTHEASHPNFIRVSAGEQYCTVYPDVDHIFFGTDFVISGMWRMNRISKNKFTDREPCFIFNSFRITHIPTDYFKDETGELFALSMLGVEQDAIDAMGWSTYLSMRLDSTLDGVTWKEVWRSDVGGGSFGQNAGMTIFKHKDKIFMQIYGDAKFSSNATLVVFDYK